MPNPILDREPHVSTRDPAMFFHKSVYYCFHTAAEKTAEAYALFVDVIESRDLFGWSPPRRLTHSSLNFSSPGNIIGVGAEWVLCVQSYPIRPGEAYGSDESRLWLMTSRDLTTWQDPRPLQPRGCDAAWASSRRQIDPYLIEHDGHIWCLYKTDGKLGLLTSPDLHTWHDASPEQPVLSATQTPDGATVENPCVVHDGASFVMFFSPCRLGRGIGMARSDNLTQWHDVHYLDFPELPWAAGGPTAAMVLDTRAERGNWTMVFHGDRQQPHGAALGVAWSDDLEHWHCPMS